MPPDHELHTFASEEPPRQTLGRVSIITRSKKGKTSGDAIVYSKHNPCQGVEPLSDTVPQFPDLTVPHEERTLPPNEEEVEVTDDLQTVDECTFGEQERSWACHPC